MVDTTIFRLQSLVEEFIIDVYRNREVSYKRKAINIMKNIIFVFIDEIEDGNINTFFPLDAGIIPSSPEGWGITLPEGEQQETRNHENLFMLFNEKAFEIIGEISKHSYKLISRNHHEALSQLLVNINDLATNEMKPFYKGKPLCEYGESCYRTKNAQHLKEFSHPWLHSCCG